MTSVDFLIVVLVIGSLITRGQSFYSEMEGRSNGCGPHPLLSILSAATASGHISPSAVMEVLGKHEGIRNDVIALLTAYDDCIRTADGMRYKKDNNYELPQFYGGPYI